VRRYEKFLLDNQPQTFRTCIYPEIPRDEKDVYIVTKDTDRLDTLAAQFYEDVTLWWIIAAANQLGKGTLVCDPGIQLRIPSNIEKVIELFDELNKYRG